MTTTPRMTVCMMNISPMNVSIRMWPASMLPKSRTLNEISRMNWPRISLSVRLFANMLAGHILILTFIGLMFILQSLLLVPVVGVATLFYLFEVIIVVGIQAFIFAALSAIY